MEPPEDVPDLSFSVSLVALDGLGDEELGLVALGEVALGALELALEPALGELGGGADDALLLVLEGGALEVLPGSLLLQAASPKASATAIANVESLTCSSRGGWYKCRGEQSSDRV